MFDLVAFGEALFRFYPTNFQRLEQANNFNLSIGGSELNIAVGLSRLGKKTSWVSRLPNNVLGRLIRNKAREQGVDTSNIIWCKNDRIGIYYLEFGASPRNSKVIYDRNNSSLSRVKKGEIDWIDILKDARVLKISGITPALSQTAKEVTYEAVEAAKKTNCKVCIDLNYRALLWTQEEAYHCMDPLMYKTDLLITTEEDAYRVFKIKGTDYEDVAKTINQKYGIEALAITLRDDITVWKNKWTAIAFYKNKIYKTKEYEIDLVDRVGGGDSFTAGFIYGYLNNNIQEGLDYGVAFSAIKQTHPGDFCISDLDEAKDLFQKGNLRISR